MNNSTYILTLALAFLLFSCSSEQREAGDQAQIASEPLEQLDPYSVPLYPAKQKAQAQDFSAELVNGETFRLSDQKGKVVLMNIWATWCAPCHDETPDFVDLYNSYKDEGLVVLGVSIDEQGRSVVEPFMEKYDVNYPMIIDDGSVMDKYGPTMGIPTSYVIDREGNLRYFAVGALTQKELEPKLQRLLSENSSGS
jgi:peroxiredoxin